MDLSLDQQDQQNIFHASSPVLLFILYISFSILVRVMVAKLLIKPLSSLFLASSALVDRRSVFTSVPTAFMMALSEANAQRHQHLLPFVGEFSDWVT